MARLLYHRDIDFPAEFVDTDRPGEEMIPNWLRCEDNPAGWISPETGKLIKLGYCIAPNQELDPTQPLSGYGEPETTFFDNVERFNLYYDQPGHPLKVLKQEYREELVNKTGGMYYQLRDCWNIRCNRGVWHDEQGKPHVCTTCWGRDHDGDGQTDVLVTTGNLTGRRGLRARGMPAPQSGLIDADCMEAGLAPHPEADKLDGDPFVPLVLTGDFFRWGVNIGVWRSRDAGVVGSFHALINQKRFGSRAVFPEAESGTDPGVGGTKPAWGYFLVSSGRPRMNYPSADGGTVNLIRFPAVEEREDWIEADAHNLYFVRNSSLAGGMDWDAVLYPTYKQILDADTAFDPLAAERGIEDIEESGVSYLYRNIASGRPMGWTASFDEYGRPNTRQMVLHIRCLGGPTSLRGGNLDYSSEEFRRFVKH